MLKILFFVVAAAVSLFPQSFQAALTAAEEGDLSVAAALVETKSITGSERLFLSALTETDAEKAVSTYLTLLQSDKKFPLRDAALFRVYSYYFSVGSYKSAEKYAAQLMQEFPQSSYTKKLPKEGKDITDDEPETKPELTKPKSDQKKPEGKEDKSSGTSKKTDYKFTLQAGVFSKKENAEQFRTELKKHYNLESFTGTRIIGGTDFIVVYAGRFISQEAATTQRDKLKSKIPGIKVIEIPSGL